MLAFFLFKSFCASIPYNTQGEGNHRIQLCSIDDVMDFAEAVRSHWAVENNLHWCLDVIFKEDEYPILDKNTAENIAIIRRIIYNRIKMQLKPKEQLCFGKRSCM